MLEPYSEKLDRAIRARRALKAGGLTALVGVPVTAGALTGVAAIGAKRDRDYKKKKKKADVDKSLGLFARPMTLRRAQAAGRLVRVKAGNARSTARGVWADRAEIARNVGQQAGIRGARAAGQAGRYVRANAMPLVVGGSVGGGAATAYQQMKERRMSKSYLAARGERAVVKGLPSALRQMSRKSPSMYKAPGATYAGQRVAASQVGRLNPAAGRGLQASVGGELRAKSRVTMAQQGGRKRLRSPRNAAAMGLNSYRNPLRSV